MSTARNRGRRQAPAQQTALNEHPAADQGDSNELPASSIAPIDQSPANPGDSDELPPTIVPHPEPQAGWTAEDEEAYREGAADPGDSLEPPIADADVPAVPFLPMSTCGVDSFGKVFDAAAYIQVPLADPPAGVTRMGFVKVELVLRDNPAHKRAFTRLYYGLVAAGARLQASGKPVSSAADVMRWLLEQVHQVDPAQSAAASKAA